ncbi:MAG TPA: biopolymer transporter ExbD [Polyangiaceae bacterium]
MTPLVDITLVLLFVFMVTAKLIVRSEALRVDLPPSRRGKAVWGQAVVAVRFARDSVGSPSPDALAHLTWSVESPCPSPPTFRRSPIEARS